MTSPERGVVGLCSWSLRPQDPRDLVSQVQAVGAKYIQLALSPLRTGHWDEVETELRLGDAGIQVRSGMMEMAGEDYRTLESIKRTGGVRPDATWSANLEAAQKTAALAHRLGLDLVTFHAGFLPEGPGDPERRAMLERLRLIIDVFADEGVAVALETGQEAGTTLLEVLAELDRPTAGVNFDPANMILYGMGEPVAALSLLAPHVRQIHVKDAVSTQVPGTWGQEVPVGKGEVDWPAFLGFVARELSSVDLMIEREAGKTRIEDMRGALRVALELGS